MPLNLIKNIPLDLTEHNLDLSDLSLSLEFNESLMAPDGLKIIVAMANKKKSILSKHHIITSELFERISPCGSIVFNSEHTAQIDLTSLGLDVDRIFFIVAHPTPNLQQCLGGVEDVMVRLASSNNLEFACINLSMDCEFDNATLLGEFYRTSHGCGWAVNNTSLGFPNGWKGVIKALGCI